MMKTLCLLAGLCLFALGCGEGGTGDGMGSGMNDNDAATTPAGVNTDDPAGAGTAH